jgi:two-component system response regulator PilR (NtrC family)
MTILSSSKRILLVEDEEGFREVLQIGLEPRGFLTEGVGSILEAKERLESERYDAIVSDLRLKDGSGLELLEWLKAREDTTPVLIMTAYATTETTVQALNLGAVDFLTKARNDIEEVAKVLKGIFAEKLPPAPEVRDIGDLVGVGETIRRVQALVGKIARADTTVLISGESGTGKEIVARLIHRYSDRAKGPFVPINCGALPETLLESELFGYEKGAFTGATSLRRGLFESAEGGILFLDEVGELPLPLQVKLLRVLQERRVRRVGGNEEHLVNVRVIGASNRNLRAETGKGKFREDLFFRLNILSIELPPLRERPEDLPVLVNHFLRRFCLKLNKPSMNLDEECLAVLCRYAFPGNVRELENLMERCVALNAGGPISAAFLPGNVVQGSQDSRNEDAPPLLQIPAEGFDLEAYMVALKGHYLRSALERCGGSKTRAAKLLGMGFRAYRYWLQHLGGPEALQLNVPGPEDFPPMAHDDAAEEA